MIFLNFVITCSGVVKGWVGWGGGGGEATPIVFKTIRKV